MVQDGGGVLVQGAARILTPSGSGLLRANLTARGAAHHRLSALHIDDADPEACKDARLAAHTECLHARLDRGEQPCASQQRGGALAKGGALQLQPMQGAILPLLLAVP